MKRWLVIAGVCAPVVVAAQPVTRPTEVASCRVTIAYAPAEVRTEIDAWVRAEPRCERELEVRVIPTDDGLYLQARDSGGRVRERVVPDAQSAAVLVVSWMADDSLGPTHVPLLEPPSVAISDPETPPEMDGLGTTAAANAPRARTHRYLMLGAIGSETSGGLRAQIDLITGRHWSLGVGGGWRVDRGRHERVAQARVVLGTSHSFGRLALRAQLGVGVDAAHPDRKASGGERMELARRGDDDVAPRAEATVLATFDIARGWGLVGGPIVALGHHKDTPAVSLFLGVQRGL